MKTGLRHILLVIAAVSLIVILFLVFAPSFKIVESPLPTPSKASSFEVYPESPLPTPVYESVNLISNGSFEYPYYQTSKQEISIAHGWSITYTKYPYCNPNHDDCDIPCPDNCKKTYVSSDDIDSGDNNVWVQGNRLEVGKATTITFNLNVTYPVSAVEIFVYHNQSIVEVSNPKSLRGKVRTTAFYSVYEWESESGWSQGKLDLFSLMFTPVTTGNLHLEIVYFIGTDLGGWSGGGWYPGIAPARRITSTINIQAHTKCRPDYGCYWASPECRAIDASSYPYRVRSGDAAQMCFAYKRMYRTYLYQQVSVEPGKFYRVGVYAHSWQCFDYDDCCNGRCSDTPDWSNFRIGINPHGADDPHDSRIAWSEYKQIFDSYRPVSVIAMAEALTVTVVIEESPWINFAKSTDSYLDDAFMNEVYLVLIPLVIRR